MQLPHFSYTGHARCFVKAVILLAWLSWQQCYVKCVRVFTRIFKSSEIFITAVKYDNIILIKKKHRVPSLNRIPNICTWFV